MNDEKVKSIFNHVINTAKRSIDPEREYGSYCIFCGEIYYDPTGEDLWDGPECKHTPNCLVTKIEELLNE